MTDKEHRAKLREIQQAMRLFPKEIRKQERAYREKMKIQKAFGKLSLELGKSKKK